MKIKKARGSVQAWTRSGLVVPWVAQKDGDRCRLRYFRRTAECLRTIAHETRTFCAAGSGAGRHGGLVCETSGCTIARSGGEPSHGRFLTVGSVLFEIYRNPKAAVPDYSTVDPLLVHLAFTSENLKADRDRLGKSRSARGGRYRHHPAGDEIMMLRDPWSIPIQFVKRADPML